ncbi:MAG: DUF423 domain-containing protein [Bacteroidetes bacterium]|nr:DUF423 domain-containing protein [Bacteroidota bacterium]
MDVSKTVQQRWLRLAAFSGAAAVLLGAFGAHSLERTAISASMLSAYETAVMYHFLHTLALGLAVLSAPLCDPRWWRRGVIAFVVGIGLFSGSLYAMALADAAGGDLSFLGPITPVGGVALALGWVFWGVGSKLK